MTLDDGVPLFLVSRAVDREIGGYGHAVREFHRHRTRNHQYLIETGEGAAMMPETGTVSVTPAVTRTWEGNRPPQVVLLDDGDSNDSNFQHDDSNCCQRESQSNNEFSSNKIQNDEITHLDQSYVQQTQEQKRPEGGSTAMKCASVPANAVIKERVHPDHPENLKIPKDKAPFSDSNCCQSAENCCHSGESADTSHDRPDTTSVPANAVIKERVHADHAKNLKILKDKAQFSDSNCCQYAENCCH